VLLIREKIFLRIINSVDNEDARTVGAEYVVYETIKELQIDRELRSLGLNRFQLAVALGVIVGRMITPGSERATHQWLQNVTGLDELMGVDFSGVSLDSVYKASDLLLKNKGSRKNKFTFLMARSSSSNLVVEYSVSKRSAAFVGQTPFFLCGNVC